MVINSNPSLWSTNVGGVQPPVPGKSRRIRGGPLLNLAVLQAAIVSGQLDEDGVWAATRRCRNSLEDYGWSFGLILEMINCLLPQDYKNSEWCDVDGSRCVPSDVYRIRFDETRKQRNPKACEVYLKFSIDDDGALTLVLVQSHLS